MSCLDPYNYLYKGDLLAIDLNFLKKRLINLNIDYDKSIDDSASYDGWNIPINKVDLLKVICKSYGLSFMLIDSDISDEQSCGYNRANKLIYLVYSKTKEIIGTYDILKVFCHELAHGIQHIVLEEYGTNTSEFCCFYYCLMYERIAERLAYFIAKKYFSDWVMDLKLTHREYKAYRSKKDISFLYKHHQAYLLETHTDYESKYSREFGI